MLLLLYTRKSYINSEITTKNVAYNLEGLNKKDAFEFYPPTILSSKIPSKSHQF